MENQLIKSNLTIENTNLTPIEIALGVDEDGRTTAKRLYDFLGLDKSHYSRWAKKNIEENEFAVINEDYSRLAIDGERNPNPTIDYKLAASFAKKLAMGTHNEKGEAAKRYFIKVEEKLKQKMIDTSKLSPELQMFNKLFNALAEQELTNKQIVASVEETKQEVQSMRDVIALNPNSWRSEVSNLLNKMAIQRGGTQEAYKEVRDESYKLLNERAGAKLEIRLTNRRRKVLEETGSKSKAVKVSKLDVIADDKRLTEVYIAIVKEMAIKYKVA